MEDFRETPLAVQAFEEKLTLQSAQPHPENRFAAIVVSVKKEAKNNVARQLARHFGLSEKESRAILGQLPIILQDHLSEQEALCIQHAVTDPGATLTVTCDTKQKKKCFRIVWPERDKNKPSPPSLPAGTSDRNSEATASPSTQAALLRIKDRLRHLTHTEKTGEGAQPMKTLVAAAPPMTAEQTSDRPADVEKLSAELAQTRAQLEQALTTSFETSSYWIREKNEMQNRILELEKQLEQKTHEANVLSEQKALSNTEADSLRQELHDLHQQIESARQEKLLIEQERTQLQAQLQTVEDRLTRTQEDLVRITTESQQNEAAQNILREEMAALRQQSQETAERLRIQIDRQEYDVAQWQNALKRERDHLSTLQTQLSEAQVKLEEQSRTFESDAQKWHQKAAEDTARIGELESIQRQLEENLRQQTDTLRATETSHQQELEQIRQEAEQANTETRQILEERSKQIEKVTQEYEQAAREREDIHQRLRETLTHLSDSQKRTEETNAGFDQQLKAAAADKLALQGQLEELQIQLSYEISEKTRALEARDQMKAWLQALQSEYTLIEQERDEIKIKTGSLEDTLQTLEKQSRQHNDLKQSWESKIRTLEQRLEDAGNRGALAEEKLAAVTAELERLKSESEDRKSRSSANESALAASRQSEANWKSECVLWRERHAALEQIKDGLIARLREEEARRTDLASQLAQLERSGPAIAQTEELPGMIERLKEQLDTEKIRYAQLEQEYGKLREQLSRSSHTALPRRQNGPSDLPSEMSLVLALEDQLSETKKWKNQAEELQKELARLSERLQFLK